MGIKLLLNEIMELSQEPLHQILGLFVLIWMHFYAEYNNEELNIETI